MGMTDRPIVMASDHRGAALKEGLLKLLEADGYEVRDYGTDGSESVDYPDFVAPAARAVARGVERQTGFPSRRHCLRRVRGPRRDTDCRSSPISQDTSRYAFAFRRLPVPGAGPSPALAPSSTEFDHRPPGERPDGPKTKRCERTSCRALPTDAPR